MFVLLKNTFIKVKKSFGRFISLLMIVALGVGFFAGIRATTPDVISTIDTYYDEYNLMDFKIVSTMGLTDYDVEELQKLEHVDKVVPSYSLDVLSDGEAIKIHALENEINQVTLIDGKMPENSSECIADSQHYNIGDVINISTDVNDSLKNNTYTVVGTCNSVLYIYKDYGISSLGNGKLTSYIFVPRDNFITDYYTEIYLTAKNAKDVETYSDDYEEYFNNLENELLVLKPIQETRRYEQILEEATKEITDAENELNDAKSDGQKELDDAKNELDTNREKLNDAKSEINKNASELSDKKESTEKQFENAENEIANGWKQINSTLSTYNLTLDTLDENILKLENTLETLNTNLDMLEDTNSVEYTQISASIAQYEEMYNGLKELQTNINNLETQEQTLQTNIQKFNTEIENAENEIASAKSEISTQEQTLEDGYNEYEDQLEKFNTEIRDAEQEIQEAKDDLDSLEKPEWYLLDRTDNNGYIELNEDTLKIKLIAQVFPVFFMLVVALMSLNTMTRMIEEERSEIGTLKSLGYSNFKIILSYIIYVSIATVFGTIIGFVLGNNLIPRIIYSVYTANYILPELILSLNILMFNSIFFTAIILMLFVTIFTCTLELKTTPASLLRPIPPKMGKKILLERVNFIWKRLSFTWKVTIRNMFRYKKRVFMTLIGIAGCTALLLTGFGIRDSVTPISKKQYGEIFKYDDLIVLDEPINNIDDNLKTLLDNEKVENPTLINQSSFTFEYGEKNLEAYLIVPSNIDEFYNYFNLNSIVNDNTATLNDDGAIVTQKLASLLDLSIGDTFKIRDTNNVLYILKVADIVENYSLHYIYVTNNYYKDIFNEDISYNMIVSNNSADENVMANNLIAHDNISYISFTSDSLNTFNNLIAGLNRIVYLIIVASSLLALIVLYNLTTINISERTREIATLKVLGFYSREVNTYIYRETICLTILGIFIGLILGVFLHLYIITLVEIDSTVFIKSINIFSYILAFLITIVFSIIIQIITFVKLKNINMIESLKSVE